MSTYTYPPMTVKALDGAPDPAIALRTKAIPIAAFINRRSSNTLLFHAALPSMQK